MLWDALWDVIFGEFYRTTHRGRKLSGPFVWLRMHETLIHSSFSFGATLTATFTRQLALIITCTTGASSHPESPSLSVSANLQAPPWPMIDLA